jgi:hypothetical protein
VIYILQVRVKWKGFKSLTLVKRDSINTVPLSPEASEEEEEASEEEEETSEEEEEVSEEEEEQQEAQENTQEEEEEEEAKKVMPNDAPSCSAYI